MARLGSPNLGLGLWLRGEKPGAGSQTVDNPALNGNWLKLDTAVGTEHNVDGTHKADVIHKANINSDVADGSTLERHSSNKYLQVKASGITATQLATDAVTTVKILAANVTLAKMAANSVDTTQLVDDSVTTAKIEDDAVTAVLISHDNNARKQVVGPFTLPTGQVGQNDYMFVAGVADTDAGNKGPSLGVAGCIVGAQINVNGTIYGNTLAYNTGGAGHFDESDVLSINTGNGTAWKVRINGNDALTVTVNTSDGPVVAFIIIEFDD